MSTKHLCRAATILFILFLGLARVADAARGWSPGFTLVQLNLPGLPASIQPADLDGDGHDDLVVVVAYNEWDDVAHFEQTSFDGVEELVEVMHVVSALITRRELRLYRGLAEGNGLGPLLTTLDLDASIHALEVVKPSQGPATLIALTDDGLSRIRYDRAQAALVQEALAAVPTRFTGEGRFYTDFRFLFDLDRDGHRDALLPIEDGWTVVPATPSGFAAERATTLRAPEPRAIEPADETPGDTPQEDTESGDTESEDTSAPWRRPRQPQVRDLNGDGLDELIVLEGHQDFDDAKPRALVARNRGGFRFDPLSILVPPAAPHAKTGASLEPAAEEPSAEQVVYVGDLDGDGQAVAVLRQQIDRWSDPTIRQEISEFKRPLFGYRLFALGEDLTFRDERDAFEASGYNFEGAQSDGQDDGIDFHLPGGFQDLDGDGRLDLVSINVELSVLPFLTRVLIARSIKVRLDFQVACQQPDGRFEPVENMSLSGRLKINMRRQRVRHLSQFNGDFDGDGRADFVQLGSGRKVIIHHGQPGCRYPSEGETAIVLENKPKHLGLLRILDLNGDDRSDLFVVHPLAKPKPDRSTPVRVDFYLSQSR